MTDDKLTRFVEDVNERVRSDGEKGRKPDRVRHKLDVIVSRCGWKHRSDARMKVLEARLSEVQISCDPPITDSELPRDAWISLRRGAPPVPVQRMPKEESLEEYLEQNWYLIPPLDGYGSHHDRNVVTRQFRLPTGECVDLLFKDRPNKRWLVVELKNDKTRGAVAQLRGYMHTIVETGVLPAGYTIEGMIISPSLDPLQIDLLHAPGAPGKMHWWLCEMQLSLRPAPGSVERETGDVH